MNFRMFTAQCRRVMSGMATCRREPSGRAASTNGIDRSSRRPEDFNMTSTRSCTSSSVRTMPVSSERPDRAQ